MANYPLNIALIIEDYYLPIWQIATLKRIASQDNAYIKLVILAKHPKKKTLESAKFSFFRKIRNLESKFLEKTVAADTLMSINEIFTEQLLDLDSETVKNEYFAKEINLVFNLASGLEKIPNYLVENSAYGAWYFFYNKQMERSPEWAGLQEFTLQSDGIVNGLKVSSSYFQQDTFLWISYSSRQNLLSKTHDNLLWKMAEFIPILCRQASQFRLGEDFIRARSTETLEDSEHYLPKSKQGYLFNESLILLLTRFLFAYLKRLLNKLTLHEAWVLLKTEQNPVANFGQLYKSNLFYRIPEGSVADPCLVEENGQQYLFFEEYVGNPKKGRIVCATLRDLENDKQPKLILEKNYHLSYPFVFKDEDVWYLVPESAENQTVDLYRCKNFPYEWEYVKSLLTNVQAYDATLYKREGRWWMFVNLRPHASASANELLYLFSAENLLADYWQAHPANPISNHADKARPAGALFEHNQLLYRPSQNCAGSYGRGLNLNTIIEWNEHSYKEKTVDQCIPKGQASLEGMHSLSYVGNTSISDGIYTRKRWHKER